jgi:hypothetical protein
MFPPENPQPPALPKAQPKPRRHNGKFCSFSNRQRIVNALAAGDPKYLIARALHVSEHTVYAVAEQEWQKVAERKARIAAQAERAATKAFERINQKLDSEDDIPLNQLTITGGVCVDKLLALRGDQNIRIDIQHGPNVGNIFEAFHQFHADALRIIHARQAEEAQQPPPLSLPDSPPTPPDPTQ